MRCCWPAGGIPDRHDRFGRQPSCDLHDDSGFGSIFSITSTSCVVQICTTEQGISSLREWYRLANGGARGIGSTVWTGFELLWPEMWSARTTTIASWPTTSAQNRCTHPAWSPSRDYSRTTREPATSNRQSTSRDQDGRHCGGSQEEYSRPFAPHEPLKLTPATKKHWSETAISGQPVQPVLAGRRLSEPPVS